ncbi:HPr kinase [Oleiphilus messinensis]|uniref:HPr kinase n=2 Tax=Oleiphilus messinensis TaxID=141451 RepID=A0A1Y0I1Q9_9GAMM|nr:HPr kinase [Oleiphilus messinensis]
MFVYDIYGLTLGSEIECPELFSSKKQPDVFLRTRPLSEFHYEQSNYIRVEVLDSENVLVRVRDSVLILVQGNHTIWIDSRSTAPLNLIRLNALGTAMLVIMMKHGILPIHGNGILHRDKCVIFAGHSGRGKSTLAASFMKRGCPLISDDICAIKLDENNQPWVYPGVHQIKLKQDSADSLAFDLKPNNLFLKNGKYVIPMAAHLYERTPKPVQAIYSLEFHDHPEFSILPLSLVDSIIVLKEYTARFYLIDQLGLGEPHFQVCSRLANKIKVQKLRRPKDLEKLDHLVQHMLDDNLT